MRIWNRLVLLAFLVVMVVLTGAYVISRFSPTELRARALLQVAAHQPQVLFGAGETETPEDYRRYQKTQRVLVRSRLVLTAALQDQAVKGYRIVREQIDPVAWLERNLEVEFVSGSEVMEIALRGDDPIEIAGLVNAVKNAYVNEFNSVDAKLRADRHAKLQQMKIKFDELLKERREGLRAAGGPALDPAPLNTDIAELEDASRKSRAELEALTVELAAPPRIRTIEDAVPPLAHSRGTLWGRLTNR
jgi:hypothetical protein